MKSVMLLFSVLAGIMLSSAALARDGLVDPMANATIVDLKWTVPISPDRNDTVIGTIQDVAKHLSIVDPEGFAAINKSITEAVAAPWPQRPAVSYSSNKDPHMYEPTSFACGVYHDTANGIAIKQGVGYLRGITGVPVMGPGGSCGRVSCSSNSAIYWCNYSDEDMALDGFGRIADGAQDLVTSCSIIQDDGSIADFSGNQLFGGDWWVVVHYDQC